MTGFSASWRKASPFAAPNAIFILVDHGRGSNTLENRLFSTLPRAMYSYIKTRCSSSQQYPINLTKFG
uniref:Uncharacterized protein MANES_15G110500 n=1 Tax=Rhizophora mucronata TaxID=61149 RepID=A0A2P2J0F3_RHIMU